MSVMVLFMCMIFLTCWCNLLFVVCIFLFLVSVLLYNFIVNIYASIILHSVIRDAKLQGVEGRLVQNLCRMHFLTR